MPSNQIPEDVREHARRKLREMDWQGGGISLPTDDQIIDAIAPLIIEWATEQGKIEALEMESSYFFEQGDVEWDGFGVSNAIDIDIAAIRAQFTDETGGQ